MKKRKIRELKQLNKSTVIKLILFILLVAILEVATGLFAFNQFSTRTYKQEYIAAQERAEEVVKGLSSDPSEEFADLETAEGKINALAETLKNGGVFTNYIIFSETQNGRVIYGDGIMQDGANLKKDFNLSIDNSGTFTTGGKTYLYAPAKLGNSGYRIAGISDFTARKDVIDNLMGNVVACLIVSGILVVLCFIVYTYALKAKKERAPKFKYLLTIDKAGKVLKSNAAFKKEFNTVSQIKSPEHLDRKDFNLITLNTELSEKLVALRVDDFGPHTKVYAGDVSNAETFVQTTQGGLLDADGKSIGSLSNVFESFIQKGKRTLLGILYVSNLEQIKTLFGKQMALDIQQIILKKTREKFTYAYEIDFAYIGVAFPDGKKLDHLMADMDDVIRYISQPIKMDDNLFTLELKSGFAMCDRDIMTNLDFAYGYKAAEAALKRVEDTHVAEYIVYNESQRKLYEKYFITFDIKQMLSEGAFEMEYQPQYNIKEARIEGFEALFRVKKSWNVNVDTFSFITYAERTGAMVQLGDFIFDTGMQFAKRLAGKKVSVSLNVSPVQLMQAGFTENFLRLYKKHDLQKGSICVEITESFLMTNFTETLKKLDILTANGIDVHLDDFGTEYSSLLYIKKLPISTIKIDKEFVKDVLVSKESQAIIKFITAIAKLLNRTTICEGVETPQEFDMLNYLGCDTIQGWLIGKSMKPEAALQIVDTFDYKKVVAARNGK